MDSGRVLSLDCGLCKNEATSGRREGGERINRVDHHGGVAQKNVGLQVWPAKIIQLSEYLQVTGTVQPVTAASAKSARGLVAASRTCWRGSGTGSGKGRSSRESTTWKPANSRRNSLPHGPNSSDRGCCCRFSRSRFERNRRLSEIGLPHRKTMSRVARSIRHWRRPREPRKESSQA